MIRSVLTTFAAAACYGLALGAAHSDLYAERNALKFPLLIATTALVCALAYWIVALAFVAPLSFGEVQRVSWRLFRDSSMLLASMSPVVLFLALVLRASDDGQLGEYDFFLAANISLIAIAGTLALVQQARFLIERHGLSPGRVRGLVVVWLLISATVGGQAAFYMRPFFGFPATRGGHPPFFLGAAPDWRGATNFFEAVLQTIERPPLVTPYGPGSER